MRISLMILRFIKSSSQMFDRNAVQATARDCLAVAMERVNAAGYPIVFHVHDEIVCEVEEKTADNDLCHICGLMGEPIAWAPGLLLKAEGYVSQYFKKD